jgi:Ethanolamine utilization protein EutJ (predicted chaperonin)
MSEEPQNLTLEQYVSALRNQIVLSYDGAKEVALRNFDDMSKKFGELYNKAQAEQKPQVAETKKGKKQ